MKRTTKKLLATVMTLVMMATLLIATPIQAEAAAKKGLTDVGKKNSNYTYIMKVYNAGGLKGLVSKKGAFQPKKTIKRYEFTRIAVNLYGNKVKVKSSWMSSAAVTQKWANEMTTELSKQLGTRVTWSGGAPKAKISRGDATFWYTAVLKYNPAT